MSAALDLSRYRACLERVTPVEVQGKVTQVVGLVVEASGPACRLGAVCDIHTRERRRPLAAEVMGFRENRVLLMPLEEIRGIAPGCRVVARQQRASVRVGSELLGRVIDGLGLPIDGKGPVGRRSGLPAVRRGAQPHETAAHPRAARSGHPRRQRPALGRLRPAHGHFCRLGRGQEHAARHDRAQDRGRRQRHRAHRRARTRGQRLHRTGPRARRASGARW